MLDNIFIAILVFTVFFMMFNLRNKYNEGLVCAGDSSLSRTLQKKVAILNESIRSQSKQIGVIKNAYSNILDLTNNFQFKIGSTEITDSKGPSLDISGKYPNPILNITFVQPPGGDFGFTGEVASYGPPGLPGRIGDKGRDGYWGGLQ
jgi:hypothetical protein